MAKKTEIQYSDVFEAYLVKRGDAPKIISNCLSRCRRVQRYEGDLWEHFKHDGGNELLSRLTYTTDDMRNRREPTHRIDINGGKGYLSIYEGTQSLHTDLLKYFDFLKSKAINKNSQ